jgi:uncharacterized membrane protein YccC
MRTSGAANDWLLTVFPIVAAVLIVTVLFGEPTALFRWLNNLLGSVVAMLVSAAQAIVASI